MKYCNQCKEYKSLDKFHKRYNSTTALCGGCRRKNHKQYTRNIKLYIIKGYGSKCMCCGESNPDKLTIDHIYSDGNVERQNGLISTALYRKLIKEKFPKDKYQLLCCNCNFSKGHYGYCPHELERKFGKEYSNLEWFLSLKSERQMKNG